MNTKHLGAASLRGAVLGALTTHVAAFVPHLGTNDSEGPKLDLGPEPQISSRLSIRDLMTEPLLTHFEGDTWVRTRDLRASFGAEGFTVYPVFGSASEHEWPIRFDVDAITRGGAQLGSAQIDSVTDDGHSVTIQRAGAREVYHLGLDSIEQTFVFDRVPGSGDLAVRMDVATDLAVRDDADGLRFVHGTFGEVTYGEAFVLDASGRREAIARTWDGEHLTLTVPEAFLAEAVLPVTIDPPVQAFVNDFGVDDDQFPDICYAASPGRYFVCWEEYTSASNGDVYISMFTPAGAYVSTFAVETANLDWTRPRVAYSGAGNRLLIVGTHSPQLSPWGAEVGTVAGFLFSAVSQTPITGLIQFHSSSHDVYQPDVGGTNRTDWTGARFLVSWTRERSGGDRSVEYCLVNSSGVITTQNVTASVWPGERHFQPAVSESSGDHRLPGEAWTLVWTRDTGTNGLGEIWARRVRLNGNHTTGTGNHVVQGSAFNSNPTVTSLLDQPLPGTGDRPAIVAWERHNIVLGGGPQNRDIEARVIVDGQAFGHNPISRVHEDFDGGLDQFGPSIATDGDGFVLSYSEGYWFSPSDHDMYMVSGHVATSGTDVLVGLAERHQLMAGTSSKDHQGRVAMQQDGDHLLLNDDGACIWLRELSSNGGELRGTTVDIHTTDTADEGSIGIQYCDANPNSVGSGGGRNASWLWIRGNQRFDRIHLAHCVDMPLNSFGYLLCSLQSGNTNMPAGSQGRLCLGGSIGRYTSDIGSSGTQGRITTTVRPQMLPQPSGSVAVQPGETWCFQLWHRDTVGGQSTSNFSNACRVTFTQ